MSGESEVDEKLAALMTNATAVQAIAAAVEGTIGPKGLDTMLVDRFGDVTITNAVSYTHLRPSWSAYVALSRGKCLMCRCRQPSATGL